jgi:hypothetical protein
MNTPDEARDVDAMNDDLIREFSTPLDELDTQTRARVDQTRAWAEQQRAAGNVAPASNAARHPDPIGLDDNLQPFPPKTPRREPTERSSHE